MTSDPNVSVVMVNYNGGAQIEQCIDSIFKNPPRLPFEVIVVDNASQDGSPETIVQRFPEVQLIRLPSNIGLAKAFNKGIDASVGTFVLSLDDGTAMLPDAITALIDFLEENPAVGGAGSRLFDPDMTIQQTARRFPTPLNALFGRRSILTRVFPNNPISARYLMPDHEDREEPFEVEWVSSAALMVRREVLDKIGAMDPDFFVYWVDADWCYRIREAGWQVWCVPRSRVTHDENLKTGKRKHRPRARMTIDFHRGAYRFYRKHYLSAWWTPVGLLAAAGLYLRAGIIVAAGQISWFFQRVGVSK